MIVRMWRGWIRTEKTQEYVDYIEATGLSEYRATPGNQGAQMLTRDLGDGRTEVITRQLVARPRRTSRPSPVTMWRRRSTTPRTTSSSSTAKTSSATSPSPNQPEPEVRRADRLASLVSVQRQIREELCAMSEARAAEVESSFDVERARRDTPP